MLNEKAGGKFGGMNKGIKFSKKTGSASDKCSVYDKDYHYPSGKGVNPGVKGGNGAKQHTDMSGHKYHRPSEL